MTPRADGPAGKIRVKRKDTGKTTFVSKRTLEEHPDLYENPQTKRRDKRQEKQDRRRLIEKEKKRRIKEKAKDELAEEKRRSQLPEEERTKLEKEDKAKQKAKEQDQQAKEDRRKRQDELEQKQEDRWRKEEEGREKSRVTRERLDTWKQVANDHPELTPKQQKERKKTFMETGIDSGGQSAKAIRWWLQHHGHDVDEGVNLDKPKEQRKLDRKSVQEHYKYGPKPNKRGECGGQLKAVKVGNLTICVDPNVYDVGE